jgi:hypothetical protein
VTIGFQRPQKRQYKLSVKRAKSLKVRVARSPHTPTKSLKVRFTHTNTNNGPQTLRRNREEREAGQGARGSGQAPTKTLRGTTVVRGLAHSGVAEIGFAAKWAERNRFLQVMGRFEGR